MRKRRLLNPVVGLLLLLSACGSPRPAATLAPTDTVAPPTSTSAPPASPTLPPATITPAPPTGTAVPSATVPAAPSNTPAPTADPLHTACDHPYWPLRQGAIWHLQLLKQVYTETVTAVTGDMVKAEATLVDQYADGSTQTVLFECDQDGLAYGNATFSHPDGHNGTKKVVASTGRFLVAVDKLVPGAKWSWSLTADYSMPVFDNGVFKNQSEYSNVSSQDCTVTQTETLTLTVGSFPALRVACKGTSLSEGGGLTSTFSLNAELDYGRGFGPNGDLVTSYQIP